MADIQLNLLYNDNGAQNNVDRLVNVLRQIESRRYNINLSLPNMDRTNAQLHDMADQLENIRKMSSGRPGEMFQGLSLSGLESAIQKAEASVNRYKQIIADFYGQLRNTKDAKEYDSILNQIENSNEGLINSTKQLASLRTIFDSLSETSGFKNLNQQIEDTIKNIENLQKYGTTNVTHDEAVGRRVSAMLGLSALPSSATTEVPQSPRGQYARYLDYSGISESLKAQEEEVKEVTEEVKKENRNVFADLQQVATSVFQLLKRGWSDFKSVVEAPLNLTGVNQLVSFIDKLEGGLLLNQISSNITSGFSRSLERYDILQTYPKIIESLGYTSDEATKSMDRLYKSVLGLPTAFGDIVNSAQYFTLVLDDLDRATDLAIAANNAFVASGASSQQVTYGMRQLQYIMDGTQLRSTQWYSLIRSMPVALKEVGIALGYPDYSSFTADLIKNKIANEEFIDALIDVGLHSEKLGNVLESMKERATAALTNVENAAMRMGETWLSTLDTVLERTGGKGLEDNIKGVSSIIDHISEVGTEWIETHGDEIQGLIDKFMSIDWSELIPNLFEGLIKIADKALDNIDEWIPKIGNILSTAQTLFNSIDNSRTIKVLEMLGGSIGGGLAFGSILKSVSKSAGNAVAGGGGLALGGTGLSLSSMAPYLAAGAGAGGIFASIVDLVYQLIANDFSTGFKTWTGHWGAFGNIFSTVPSSGQNVISNAIEKITDWIEFVRESGLSSEFMRRDLYGSRIDDMLGRYSKYDFASKDRMSFLGKLSEYIRYFGTDVSGLDNGVKLGEDLSRLISDMNLVDAIKKPYDEAIKALDAKKEELLKEIESINEEIAKEFAGVEVNSFKFYEAIYGANKKFFSEQFKEASGWSYSNTTRDRAEFLEKNLPKVNGILDDITNYALENYSDDEGVLAVVAKFMADFDWNDPNQLAVLIKNYGGKSMQEVFEQYFEQQAKNLNLDEAIRTALLEHQKELTEGRLEGVNIEQEQLEEKSQSLLAPYIDQLDDDFEFLKDDYGEAIEYVEKSGSRLVDLINNIFNRLNPEKPKNNLDSFFGSIYNTIRSWVNLINSVSSRTITPRFSGSYGSEGVYSANGGFILPPKGTDTIPAMLTPGEYVQRRAAVQYFGKSFMDRINALDLRGALRSVYTSFAAPYATGGFVRSDNRSYRDNHATVNQVFNSSNASTGLRRVSRFVRALN